MLLAELLKSCVCCYIQDYELVEALNMIWITFLGAEKIRTI